MTSPTVVEIGDYAQIAAGTNQVRVKPGQLLGIFVSAASGGPTITVYDDAAAGTTKKIVDTFTPTAGQFYPLPFAFLNGLYIVLGGTVSCTVASQI